jgi:phosphoribosyl 1,2-cyclic phosphodiesterase
VRVTVWGCRGSVATPGPETVTFGGNTACVEIALDDDAALVLDAGTGIRELGFDLQRRGVRQVHLCLTHLHLDHLEGLRFFAPLWDDSVSVDIWGPPSHLLSLRQRIARYFSPPLFPIELRDVPARLSFHDVEPEAWTIGDAEIAADLVLHPGPTVGYRIERAGSSFAYIPDHEPALAGLLRERTPDWISGSALATDVDLVVHDAQYFEDEYPHYVGWGHSSVAHAVAFASAAGAHQLMLFHHEPRHSDHALERLEDRARELAAAEGLAPPALAREGMVVELPSRVRA